MEFNSNSNGGHELQFNSKSIQVTASWNFQNSHLQNHQFMEIFACTIPAVVFTVFIVELTKNLFDPKYNSNNAKCQKPKTYWQAKEAEYFSDFR